MSSRVTFILIPILIWSCTDSNPGRRLPPRPVDAGSDPSARGGLDGSVIDGFIAEFDSGSTMDVSMPLEDMTLTMIEDSGIAFADMALTDPDSMVPEVDGALGRADAAAPIADASAPMTDAAVPDAASPAPDMECMNDCDGDEVSIDDGDCDDADPEIFPGQVELCDGRDNDCDDSADEALAEGCYEGPDGTRGVGLCVGGIRRCAAGVFGACEAQVTPQQEVCGNDLDEDCDGQSDEACDADQDGVTTTQGDCRDDLPQVNPNAPEICDGLDNDCDDVVDTIEEACYGGAADTENVGACRGGLRRCDNGAFSDCIGEVLPAEEACGNETDDDCDGTVDEGCEIEACPELADDVQLSSSVSCMVAGTGGQLIVQVSLTNPDGARYNNADVEFAVQGAGANAAGRIGNTYYQVISAPDAQGELRVSASVGCDDGTRLALGPEQVIPVTANDATGAEGRTGGCAEVAGHVWVRVVDDAGQPIPDGWVQIGNIDEPGFQSDAANAVRGLAGESSRLQRTNADGIAEFIDFGNQLAGAYTVTAGAEGFENLTVFSLNSSAVTLALRSSETPAIPAGTARGQMVDFNNLGRDGQADMGLVMGSFDLEFLSSFAFSRLLSRIDCWDPVTRGLAGGFVGESPVPGNLYVPGQSERIGIFAATVEEHRFLLGDRPASLDNLVAFGGKVPVGEVVGLLSGGGSLTSIISLLTPLELGVRKNVNLANDPNDVQISLSVDLQNNARCRFGNVPDQASVFCISAGDWSGANGTGRLFPMGLATMDWNTINRGGNAGRELSLTTVRDAGDFDGIGYLGAVIAFYPDPEDAPDGLDSAVSAKLDRDTFNRNGGQMNMEEFFSMTRVSRDGLNIEWTPVSNESSPQADMCRIDIVRVIFTEYNPGGCSPNRFTSIEVPVWSTLVGSDPGDITLPTVPREWPNGEAAGLIDVRNTPENDRLRVRVSCAHLGRVDNFDFDRTAFSRFLEDLTHVSANTVNY